MKPIASLGRGTLQGQSIGAALGIKGAETHLREESGG
jgi:hypothetical protein